MKLKLPDTLLILLGILAAFTLLTWWLPAGTFERVEVDGRMLVVPDTYREVEANPAGPGAFILAPIRGFIEAAQIIVFIFFVAGAFGMINRTGTLKAALHELVIKVQKNPRLKLYVIPLLMLFFSIAGATFGMSEEVLVFILISLPLAFALGYDSLIGVAIPFVGAGAGFAGAFLNPFTVGIAQGIAELPPFSGWEYRILVWVLFTFIAIAFVMHYARKISGNPEKSRMFFIDQESEYREQTQSLETLGRRQQAVLILFLSSLGVLVAGVNLWHWYINEISALFLVTGILSAIICRLPVDEAIAAFLEGAKDMMKVALVIAIAKGILIVASDSMIIDTLLQTMAGAVADLPNYISVELMFFFQSLLNFFLPSGSGQAALTMPIMAPLSDILGISRQTAVLAFQLGDGLSNMIIPTSGVTMGVLALANIPYTIWFRWMLPLMLMFFLAALAVLIPPVIIFSWGP